MRAAGEAEMVPPVLSLTIDPRLVVEKGYENKVQNFCEDSLYGLGCPQVLGASVPAKPDVRGRHLRLQLVAAEVGRRAPVDLLRKHLRGAGARRASRRSSHLCEDVHRFDHWFSICRLL